MPRLADLVAWPPPDTDANRFYFGFGFPAAVLAAAYVLTFALVSGGWLPYVVAVLLLTLAMVLGVGLLLMRSRRQEIARTEAALLAAQAPDEAPAPVPDEAAVPVPEPAAVSGTAVSGTAPTEAVSTEEASTESATSVELVTGGPPPRTPGRHRH